MTIDEKAKENLGLKESLHKLLDKMLLMLLRHDRFCSGILYGEKQ